MQLNREQRRAAHKTHAVLVRKSKRPASQHADKTAGTRLLNRVSQFNEGDTTAQHILTRWCMERLVNGTATTADFDRVAMAINAGYVRALEIDVKLAALIDKARCALASVKDRYNRLGRFGFGVLELEATNEALDAQEVIVDASSPQQMHDAVMTVCKLMNVQIDSRVKRGML